MRCEDGRIAVLIESDCSGVTLRLVPSSCAAYFYTTVGSADQEMRGDTSVETAEAGVVLKAPAASTQRQRDRT